MPPLTEQQLNKQYTIPVNINSRAPLPVNDSCYDPIRNINNTGFTFSVRSLLHMIGIKTAILPQTEVDEAIRSAHLYTNILDFTHQDLFYKENLTLHGDLLAPRSQELGIAIACLIASNYYNIPLDNLEPIETQGTRFDYRGVTNNNLNCIFEAKGASSLSTQSSQVTSGINKKQIIRAQGTQHDVELIISTYIGEYSKSPKIVIADPIFTSSKFTFSEKSKIFFRMRHYVRVLQFSGLTKLAYVLNKEAIKFKNNKQFNLKKIKQLLNNSDFDLFEDNGREFIGTWSYNTLPDYKKYNKLKKYNKSKYQIFQGLDTRVFHYLFDEEFQEIEDYSKEVIISRFTKNISMFSDGSIQVIRVKNITINDRLISFGKFEGKKWSDVSQDYLEWIIAKFDENDSNRLKAIIELKKRK